MALKLALDRVMLRESGGGRQRWPNMWPNIGSPVRYGEVGCLGKRGKPTGPARCLPGKA